MLKAPILLAWRGMGRLTRITLKLSLLLAFAGALLLLALRYRILPDIERYHADITAAAVMAVGQPLTIGKIEADWDGLRPRLLFTDVKILDQQGRVALSLPRIENTVAWTSLPTAELRFHSLLIDSPDLSVRRDGQGRLYVAGIPLEGRSAAGQDSADWLLHQSSMIIRNGRITWQDEMRAAPLLELKQVDLNIENRRGRHRFALRASPPEKLASRLDVRGRFYGDSFSDMSDWRGQLYTQLDYADVLAWKPWLPLPRMFKRGQGALRLWLGFDAGRVRSLDADVALASVRARLAEELPQLDLSELRGRIGWRVTERGFEISADRLALQMRGGFKLKPTDFYLRLADGAEGKNDAGEIRANALELSDLVTLASYLPLSDELKSKISTASPQGRVSGLDVQWRIRADDTLRFDVKARFDGLALNRIGDNPGFSGLSGEVDGGASGGAVKLDSRKFMLDAPQLFSQPVVFDTFRAQLGWQRNSRGLEFKLSNVDLANADLAGTLYGSYQTEAEGPGSVDATVDMKRVAVKMAGHYTPVPAVNQETRDWLKAALQGGEADKFRVRLRGDLRDFPFVGNERGIFRLEARAKGVVMEFVEGWPRLEEAQTQLLIEGKKLEIVASTATTAGAHLQNVKVGISDLLDNDLVLQVRGEAADATQRCLDYIGKSPVNGYLDGFTEGVSARGDGKLNLQLDIPLTGDAPVKVRGDYRFINNEVDLGENVPLLRNVNGTLLFTESAVNAGDIGAQILGGAAHLTVLSEKGALVTRARGRLDLENLNRLSPHPLLRRVHGSTDWSADIRVQNKLVDVKVDSELQGIVSDLPAPFAKAAGERIPLHFEQKGISLRQEELGLRYGALLDARLTSYKAADGTWAVRRGRIGLGGAASPGGKEGIWIAGRLPPVSLEGWAGAGLASGSDAMLPNIAGIDVTLDKLTGYGSTVNALNIKGSGRNGLLSLRLASRELNGDVIWQPQGNGKLLGRFKSAMVGEGTAESVPAVAVATDNRKPTDNSGFPEVDVAVEKLTYKGRQLGKLELEVSQADGNVTLDSLRLTNPDGVLNMTGKWQAVPEQTQVNLRIDISDAGKILSRSGYPESLKDGSGTLESNLYWSGAPDTFNMNKLNGMLNLKVGKGRFLKVDAGAAKLLGVLSLQSIPRRISLDFTDVFSGGFQFESITGSAQIVNGLLLTSDMKLAGAAAKVTLSGQVDMNRETQDLKVRILPTIGDNVSLLSFAAGPVVGVGVLLTNKILRDPLDKLVSFEYNVSGSWADPKVEKVGQSAPAQSGETAAE
ncbi:MAG: TIGR02099 family protein [Nitrosomonadales bacterium]|nr:TIGR02099 family protein [Nitrosomonadales bacterium]